MNTVEINSIDDLIKLKNVYLDHLVIKSSLFGLYSMSQYFNYDFFNKGMILTLKECNSFESDKCSLAAYVKIVSSRDFEYLERVANGSLDTYNFRFIKKFLELPNAAHVNQSAGPNVLPLRYKIADQINNFLLKIKLQKIFKKFLRGIIN